MKNKLSLFAVPYVGWMSIFVVAPIIIMVVYAFSTAAGDFTLENFARMGTYTAVFTRSFKLAIIATLIALLIGYPVSYMLSKEGPQVQRIAMVLIMLPMWMNFLLRTYSWMSILENNGLLNQLFQQIGLIDLYNQIAMHFASDPAAYVHRSLPDDRYPGRRSAGYGVQLPALHDPAHLLRAGKAGPFPH